MAGLPNALDWVIAKGSVARNDCQVMANGLRDNHAVEGITMPGFRKGKLSHRLSVFRRDLQDAKVIPGRMRFDELLKRRG